MKTRKFGIFATVDGLENQLLQVSSVRFSRANRAALKVKREGKQGVFFAFFDEHNNPVGERHWPTPGWYLREKESEADQQRRNRSQMNVDSDRLKLLQEKRRKHAAAYGASPAAAAELIIKTIRQELGEHDVEP